MDFEPSSQELNDPKIAKQVRSLKAEAGVGQSADVEFKIER